MPKRPWEPAFREDGAVLVPLSQGKVAVIDAESLPAIRHVAWHFSCGYAKAILPGSRKSVGMHRVIAGDLPGLVVDHVNGDRLDNRRANLRHGDAQANVMNSRSRGGTSRFKGVCLNPKRGVWRAHICKGGRNQFLGEFTREEDAARRYDAAAIELHGEFARTNEHQGLY